MKALGELKICISCRPRIPKPATTEFFSVDRSRPDGLAKICRACNAAKSRAYYQRNREREISRTQENKRLHGWGLVDHGGIRQPIPELPPDPGAADPESTYQMVRLRESEWMACVDLAQQFGLRDAGSLIRQAVITYLAATRALPENGTPTN